MAGQKAQAGAIVQAFLLLVPKLSYEVIDSVVMALQNEKKVRDAREAFVERMVSSGWTREDAYNCVVEYQRMIERSVVTKENTLSQTEQTVKLVKQKPIINDEGIASAETTPRPVAPPQEKQHIDDIDAMVDEFYPE